MRRWFAIAAMALIGCDRSAPRPTGPTALTVDSLVVILHQDRFISEFRGRRITLRGVVDSTATVWGRTTIAFPTIDGVVVVCRMVPEHPEIKHGDSITVHFTVAERTVPGMTLYDCEDGP